MKRIIADNKKAVWINESGRLFFSILKAVTCARSVQVIFYECVHKRVDKEDKKCIVYMNMFI